MFSIDNVISQAPDEYRKANVIDNDDRVHCRPLSSTPNLRLQNIMFAALTSDEI